jgi:Rrf2 family transcriptional regulator, iron-sulfur cluster assembly transcription factor
MFSRTAGYAVLALTYLAGQPSGRLTGAREIASATQIPMPFLWKVLRNLTRKRLVRSFKGVRGGYELARPANKLTVREVLAASPDADQRGSCVLGLSRCNDDAPCPLHWSWKDLRNQIEKLMDQTTLAHLSRNARSPKRKRSQATPRSSKRLPHS